MKQAAVRSREINPLFMGAVSLGGTDATNNYLDQRWATSTSGDSQNITLSVAPQSTYYTASSLVGKNG